MRRQLEAQFRIVNWVKVRLVWELVCGRKPRLRQLQEPWTCTARNGGGLHVVAVDNIKVIKLIIKKVIKICNYTAMLQSIKACMLVL